MLFLFAVKSGYVTLLTRDKAIITVSLMRLHYFSYILYFAKPMPAFNQRFGTDVDMAISIRRYTDPVATGIPVNTINALFVDDIVKHSNSDSSINVDPVSGFYT